MPLNLGEVFASGTQPSRESDNDNGKYYNGAKTLFRMNLSRYIGHVTIILLNAYYCMLSRMYTLLSVIVILPAISLAYSS